MSPLFGHGEDEGDDGVALEAEIERLNALSLPELGAETMTRGFGPGGPGAPENQGTFQAPRTDATRVGLSDIARQFTPAFVGRGITAEQRVRFEQLVAEGLQILERALLVRLSWRGGTESYSATRLGHYVLQQGEVDRRLERL